MTKLILRDLRHNAWLDGYVNLTILHTRESLTFDWATCDVRNQVASQLDSQMGCM